MGKGAICRVKISSKKKRQPQCTILWTKFREDRQCGKMQRWSYWAYLTVCTHPSHRIDVDGKMYISGVQCVRMVVRVTIPNFQFWQLWNQLKGPREWRKNTHTKIGQPILTIFYDSFKAKIK